MNLKWIVDPKDSVPSVSLTMLVIFGLVALVINCLSSFGKVSSIAGINDLFYSTCALYFGRRSLNFGGKSYDGGQAATIEQKVVQ